MVDAYTPDQDTIDRYVQRQLAGRKRERMELWLLENPGELEEVRLADSMRRGVKALGPPRVRHSRNPQAVILPWWLSWAAQPALGGGAAVLALAAVMAPTWMYLQAASVNRGLASQIETLRSPTARIISLPLEPTRAIHTDRPDARIILSQQPYVVLLDLSVRPWLDQVEHFHLILRSTAGEQQFADAAVNSSGAIQLALNSAALTPGHLQLVIRGDEGELAHYRIVVQDE